MIINQDYLIIIISYIHKKKKIKYFVKGALYDFLSKICMQNYETNNTINKNIYNPYVIKAICLLRLHIFYTFSISMKWRFHCLMQIMKKKKQYIHKKNCLL